MRRASRPLVLGTGTKESFGADGVAVPNQLPEKHEQAFP
jgi:hypothetical protein